MSGGNWQTEKHQRFNRKPTSQVPGRKTNWCPPTKSYPSQEREVALLDMVVLNCRSARKKTDQIHQYITEHDTDLVVLTETWLTTSSRDRKWISSLTPAGYKFINRPRASCQRGGGIVVIHKASLSCTVVPPDQCHKAHSFENLQCQLCSDSLTVNMAFIYRPPPTKKNGLTTAMFVEEFADFLTTLSMSYHQVLIAGDFNLHRNKLDTCTHCQSIKEILDILGLVQHVSFTTH